MALFIPTEQRGDAVWGQIARDLLVGSLTVLGIEPSPVTDDVILLRISGGYVLNTQHAPNDGIEARVLVCKFNVCYSILLHNLLPFISRLYSQWASAKVRIFSRSAFPFAG